MIASKSMITGKGRILLVDDEPLVLEIIETALVAEGYEVICAPNAHSALKQLDRTDFDGIVCDVRLENLDGFDLLVLSRKKNPTIAGVLMTGSPCEEDELRAKDLEVSYLSKPIVMSQLLSTVEQTLNSAQHDIDRMLAA